MDKLPACPFCGKPSEVYRKMARCSDVECHAHYIRVPIDEWNTRPIEDKLQSDITTLLHAMAGVLSIVGYDHSGVLLKAMREVDPEWGKRLIDSQPKEAL